MNSGKECKIRETNPADILRIAEILDGTLGQDFRYGPDSFLQNVTYSFIKSIEHRNEGVYVADLEGYAVGFAWFMNHPPNNGTAILEMLAVKKDKQRQGIGSRLIQESSDLFVESQRALGVNLRTLHLTTNLTNKGAQTIYTRAGYEIAGEIKDFVGKGNIEVVMVKKVSDEPAPEEYITEL